MTTLLAQYAKTQDPHALQELIQRHADLVYSTCLRIVGDPHRADDAGQAVFLVFMKKAPALPPDTPLPAWFYRTAVFVAQRANREYRTRIKHEQEAAAMRANSQEAGEIETWRALKPQLDSLLSALPSAERDAVVLRYLSGKTEPEAARELGCPVGTLSARVSRALTRLRKRFAGSAVVSATLIGLALEHHATHAAPAHFAATVHAACVGSAGASATLSAQTLAKGTLNALYWMKIKLIAAVLLVFALLGVPITERLAAQGDTPVVKGDSPPPIKPAPPAPPVVVIPATVTFAPPAQKAPLIYERLTTMDCLKRPALLKAAGGVVPDHALDCQVLEFSFPDGNKTDTAAPTKITIQCLRSIIATAATISVNNSPQEVALIGVSPTDINKLPRCVGSYQHDGTSTVGGYWVNDVVPYRIANPGIEGTISSGETFGLLLLKEIGLLPLSSTAGQPRALHETWELNARLLDKYTLPITYSLDKLEAVDGRLQAKLVSVQKKIELNPEVLPTETVSLGIAMVKLTPQTLTGECVEELRVDVENGVVLHHTRAITCKIGYQINAPAAIRALAGGDLVFAVRFRVEDTLLHADEAQALTGHPDAVSGAHRIQERWKKRIAAGDAWTKEMGAALMNLLSEKQPVVPQKPGETDGF